MIYQIEKTKYRYVKHNPFNHKLVTKPLNKVIQPIIKSKIKGAIRMQSLLPIALRDVESISIIEDVKYITVFI